MIDAETEARARVWATSRALAVHGIGTEVAESEPVLCIVGTDMPMIRCAPRASDAGALWLMEEGDPPVPIAPAAAAHLHEVIVWAKGQVARMPAGQTLTDPDHAHEATL